MIPFITSEIATIPKEWDVVELQQVSLPPQYGYTASAAQSGNAKFLRITDITDLGVNWNHVPYCNCPHDKLQTYLLRSGDIVFARIGATTGKSFLISNPPQAVFASYLIRVRTTDKIDPQFLIHFFQSAPYWNQINANKHTNLKKGVNASILKRLRVPKPPLSEQKKIAHVLSTIHRAVQQQSRIIQTTTELKKAFARKLFAHGVNGDSQKNTTVGPIPKTWELVNFANSINITQGQVDPTDSLYADMLHVGPENVESETGRFIDLQTNRESGIRSGNYYFSARHVLYSKIRPYLIGQRHFRVATLGR